MPRRFEFIEGTTSKFWEIEQSGNSFTTWWGKIGSDAQSKTKTFSSEAEAKLEYDKIVNEKTRKGYVEIGSSSAPPSVSSTRPTSVAAVKSAVSSAPQEVPKSVAVMERPTSPKLSPAELEQQFRKFLKELTAQVQEKVESATTPHERLCLEIKIADLSAAKQVFALSDEDQAATLLLIMKELERSSPASYELNTALEQTASKLCKRKLPFTDAQLIVLVKAAAADFPCKALPGASVIDQIEAFMENASPSSDLISSLKTFKSMLQREGTNWAGELLASGKKLFQRLEVLLQRAKGGNEVVVPMSPQEAWSDQAISDLKAMNSAQLQSWLKLLDHCSRTSGTTPSSTWSKKANELISALEEESFITHVHRWLSLVPQKGSRTDQEMGTMGEIDGAVIIRPQNAEILKGIAFSCTGRKDARLASALGDAAEASFKKVPNLGPRCPKLGNACVHALSSMNTKESIAQLTRVQSRAKHASVRAQIEKALNSAATKSGMSVDDLQDIGVPDFGMQEVGKLVRDFNAWSAHITIEDSNSITTSWVSSNGKTQQSVPAEVKSSAPDQVRELKKIEQDLEKLLPGLRTRLERSYVEQRKWKFNEWRERLLDHPVTGTMARRLLWTFNGRAGIWYGDHFIDESGTSFMPEESAEVELWHPIGADPQVVLEWRRWLTENRIAQPFKQCHREVYVITPAELETGTYSNRFSAHILKQHQFQHLCAQRGWQYTLMGTFDSHNTPTLNLPRWNLVVEFFVDPAAEGNEMGIYTNIASDKVQFLRTPADSPAQPDRYTYVRYESVPIAEISPILFSEVMRDVDLFVSVCSIGTDPNWTERHYDYWRSYSFGDLSVSAESRKQVLEEIVPLLRIASRCRFDGKFLIVRGDLRTYKIHLGSGNILMEPNDEYLCIVAARGLSSSNQKVFLPFEGDNMLSLILSKAMLLADDKKITDQSILTQINRRISN